MAKTIELPDGRKAEFPDDMSNEAIGDVLAKQFPPSKQPGGLSRAVGAIRNVVEPVVETAATLATGAVAPLTAIPTAIYKGAMGDTRRGDQIMAESLADRTYMPRSEGGRTIVGGIGKFIDESKLAGLPVVGNEMNAIASGIRPLAKSTAQLGSKVATIPGKATSQAVGLIANRSPEVLKQAFRAGKEQSIGNKQTFTENLRGKVDVEQMLSDAQEGIAKMQSAASAQYKNAKTGWAADKTPLKFDEIDDAFKQLEATTYEGGHSLIDDVERSKINRVGEVLKEWRDDPAAHNTLGLDALKRRIDSIYPDSPLHKNAQRVIGGTRNAVKDTIVKQAPDYAEAMAGYEASQNTLRDIRSSLTGGDKLSKEAAINKLLALSKDKEFRRTQAENLKQGSGVDLMQAAAGQSLKDVLPTGLGRLSAMGAGGAAFLAHNPWLAAALPLTSPRLIGEAAYGAGRVAGMFNPNQRMRVNALKNWHGVEKNTAAEMDKIRAAFGPEAPSNMPLPEVDTPLVPGSWREPMQPQGTPSQLPGIDLQEILAGGDRTINLPNLPVGKSELPSLPPLQPFDFPNIPGSWRDMKPVPQQASPLPGIDLYEMMTTALRDRQ